MRAEWGCDAETEQPQAELECPFCLGLDPTCQDCGGRGQIDLHRCPNTYFGPEHADVVRSVALLEVGLLPVTGGWAEQAATWVDAIGVVRGVIDRIERERRRAERD